VVARIGDTILQASELRDFAISTPQNLRSQQEGAAAREDYLRSLLVKHLLYLEAQVWELQESMEVQKRVTASWHQHLIEIYRNEQPSIQVEVDEAEIRRYFEENDLGRQRQLAGILVEEESQAQEVLAKLVAGESFADLARQYSVHKGSAAQGGVWGYISRQQARRLKIPDEVFRQLPVGALSDILPINKRYLVMRFLQDRPGSLDEHRSRIRSVLHAGKLKEAKREQVRSLAREFGWKIESAGLDLILKKAAAYPAVHRQHFSPREAIQPLFTYQGGQVTVGEYVDALWEDAGRTHAGWGMKDSAAVVAAAESTVMGPIILLEAAKRAGIPERPAEQNWLEQTRWEFMVRQVRKEEVEDKAAVSEEEAKEFYQSHEDLFRKSDQFDLIEVLVATEEKAQDLLATLERGDASLLDLAQEHTIRTESQEEPGKVHLHGRDRYVNPQLYEAVQAATIGELVGPVQVKGGYSLFKVLRRTEGELPPFSKMARRAHSLLRRQKEDRIFEELVDELLEKYQDRITIYQDELAAALPDTLIQRLSAAEGD
jgi:parvulin-like peptidyl-prolyl isomerase